MENDSGSTGPELTRLLDEEVIQGQLGYGSYQLIKSLMNNVESEKQRQLTWLKAQLWILCEQVLEQLKKDGPSLRVIKALRICSALS
jgi:hypothetical protein